MATVRGIALTLAALTGGGCGSTAGDAPAAGARPTPAHGTLESIEQKLAELEERLAHARAAVRDARESKDRALRRLTELEQTGQRLREQLAQARRSGPRSWTEIGQAVDRALVEVETATGLSED